MSHINTKCVQSGWTPHTGEPRILPIYQSTTFAYDDCASMVKVFDLESTNHIYTRLSNPTDEAVEKKIADLEGGVGAVVTSSGLSAIMMGVVNICKAGENILCSAELYGGTFNLFDKTLRNLGIDTRFFNIEQSDEEIEALIDENTRLIFGETLSNPSLAIMDLERFAAMAHKYSIPLMVDNTFPTPINCRPFEYGVDIVIHSTTKYMDGHACSLGGVVVDSGNFDWVKSGKFPCLTTPDSSYHNIVYTDTFGNMAYIIKCRSQIMRDMGMQAAPMNAFLLNLGLETLSLRMERHCSNAQRVAEFLKANKNVESVNYPGLPDNNFYDLAKKYLPNGTSGVISFVVKGGREGADKCMERLKLARIVTHVADTRTCVLHPASTTHGQLSDEALEKCGILPGMIRISVGIEHIDDIIADLEQALR